MNTREITEDLARLQGRRILFGHQSVGADIVAGLRDLRNESGVDGFRVVPLGSIGSVAGGYFAEGFIGENTIPASKCDAFRGALVGTALDSVEIALMKFCFVDITGASDVGAVFETYRRTINELNERFPSVKFVHVTVPLTAITPWWKRAVKSLLGRHESSIADNIARSRFNTLLRSGYEKGPVFDLAAIESTRPDGSRELFSSDGMEYESMVAEYTYDGGHLNEHGRRRAAAGLIRTLAALVP